MWRQRWVGGSSDGSDLFDVIDARLHNDERHHGADFDDGHLRADNNGRGHSVSTNHSCAQHHCNHHNIVRATSW